MSDLYDAAREVRDAINVLGDTTSSRGGDIWMELRNVVEALHGIKAALRDISDVMHAQYYGAGEHLGESLGEEGEPGDEDGSQADA